MTLRVEAVSDVESSNNGSVEGTVKMITYNLFCSIRRASKGIDDKNEA